MLWYSWEISWPRGGRSSRTRSESLSAVLCALCPGQYRCDINRLALRYERNYNKFLDIFRLDRRIPSYFVPGNNDVGYASCLISIEGFHSSVFHQPEHRCYIRPPSPPQIHISLRAAEPAHHCP